MTQTLAAYDRYAADFRALNGDGNGAAPQWLRELRADAWERFIAAGFPTARRGNEPYKYTNVAPIADADLRLAAGDGDGAVSADDARRLAPWSADWTQLVFVDGRYSATLSDGGDGGGGVTAMSLAEALRADGVNGGGALRAHLGRYADAGEDAFIALNTAFAADGAVVRIADGACVDAPLHLVYITTGAGDGRTASHPRTLVLAGANSRASLIESYAGVPGNRCFTNAVTEIVLGEGAELNHYRLLMESEDAFHVGVARVSQAAGSSYSGKAFERQAGLARFDFHTALDGEGSGCDLKGLYFTSGSQHMDNYINIDHRKPNATSRLYYKGILDGRSRAVFGGTVFVQPGAVKTDSHQEDKNLVLSPYAEVDSKPSLFIYADDVKCGHGATAGNIDMDTVFYMRSRGIDLETASRLLIYGFADEIIETVEDDYLRAYLEKQFLDSLPSYKFEF